MNAWVDNTLAVLQSWLDVATASVLHALVFAAIVAAGIYEARRI